MPLTETRRYRLSPEAIERAMAVIDPVFLNTPQFVNEPLSEVLGARVVLKVETLNPIRCFKGRGADFFAANQPGGTRIVTASAGNFGQAMAYACRKRNTHLTVFASVNANTLKIERMKALGAEVILEGQDFDAAKIAAKKFCASTGARMVEDGGEPMISEGAGTIAVELSKFPEPIDVMLVALGGGAILGGIARWVKAKGTNIEVIGVGARGAPSMEHSWRSGSIVEYPNIATIADGIGTRIPIPEALDDMNGTIADVLPVDDASMIEGMRLAHEHAGLVLEPSGAVGLAALIENPARFKGRTVAVILCGGNLTPEQMRKWLG